MRRDRELKLEPRAGARSGATLARPSGASSCARTSSSMTARRSRADDVVFSLERADGDGLATCAATSPREGSPQDRRPHGRDRDEISRPVFMPTRWRRSRSCRRRGRRRTTRPRSADLTKKEENFATRNAMGTGPFMLKSRERRREDRAGAEPDLVGQARAQSSTRSSSRVIGNDATRVAALLSGEVDMLYTVPPQDANRASPSTQGLRSCRSPSCASSSSASTRCATSCWNPTSRARTRSRTCGCASAFYQAIDVEAIKTPRHARPVDARPR